MQSKKTITSTELGLMTKYLILILLLPKQDNEIEDNMVVENVVTYGNLVPYFFQVNDTIMDCSKPVVNCTNNFHFALAEQPQNLTSTKDCTG